MSTVWVVREYCNEFRDPVNFDSHVVELIAIFINKPDKKLLNKLFGTYLGNRLFDQVGYSEGDHAWHMLEEVPVGEILSNVS